MDKPLHLQPHSRIPNDNKNSGSRKPVIPQRGAFSSQMLQPTESCRNSCASSLLGSPQSGYEYSPNRQYHTHSDSVSAAPLSPPPSPAPPPPPPLARSSVTSAAKRPSGMRRSSEQVKELPRQQDDHKVCSASNGVMKKNGQRRERSPTKVDYVRLPESAAISPPIETLSKKLRQQASELTRVYETLEEKNQQIEKYKSEIQEKQSQIDQLQQVHSSITSTLHPPKPRRSSIENSKVITNHSSPPIRKTAEALECKIKETEAEKHKYKRATKRIEKALDELKAFQNDRLHGFRNNLHDSPDKTKDRVITPEVFEEQQLYIRILEEAVHLRAVELQVTGHEELLMVLVELRHTIYEQEQEIDKKNTELETMQAQLLESKDEVLAFREKLIEVEVQRDKQVQQLRELNASLNTRLDQAQRRLHHQDEQYRQLQATYDKSRLVEQELREQLTGVTQSRSFSEAKFKEALKDAQQTKQELTTMAVKYEEQIRETAKWKEDCAESQTKLNELKLLQDELLNSVDKYANKAERTHREIREVKQQFDQEQAAHRILKEKYFAKTSESEALSEELSVLKHQLDRLNTQCNALTEEKKRLETTLAHERREIEVTIQEEARNAEAKAKVNGAEEQKANQMKEAMVELEAAFATSVRHVMAMTAIPSPTNVQVNYEGVIEEQVDGNNRTSDTNEESGIDEFLINHKKNEQLQVCCQALNHLISSEAGTVPKYLSIIPSFEPLMRHLSRTATNVLEQVRIAVASWKRQRSDLVKACHELESTVDICQRDMERVHHHAITLQLTVAEVSRLAEARQLELEAMQHELDCIQGELDLKNALDQRVQSQMATISLQESQINELSHENERLRSLEHKLCADLEDTTERAQRLMVQVDAMNATAENVQELEDAIATAVILTEQQNEWNQELQEQLAEAERAQNEQAESVQALKTREDDIMRRFLAIFERYMTSIRLQLTQKNSETGLTPDFDSLEEAQQRGDILQMLRVFPTLVEKYIIICTEGHSERIESNQVLSPVHRRAKSIEQIPDAKSQTKKTLIPPYFNVKTPSKPIQNRTRDSLETINGDSSKSKLDICTKSINRQDEVIKITSPTMSLRPHLLDQKTHGKDEKSQLDEQLDLLREAFRRYQLDNNIIESIT